MRFDDRNRRGFNRFVVLYQRPFLNLISQCIQIVDHVFAIIDPKPSDCDIHVRTLKS